MLDFSDSENIRPLKPYEAKTLDNYVKRIKKESGINFKEQAKIYGISDRRLRYLRKGFYTRKGKEYHACNERIYYKVKAQFHEVMPVHYILWIEHVITDEGNYYRLNREDIRGMNNALDRFDEIKNEKKSIFEKGDVFLNPQVAFSRIYEWEGKYEFQNKAEVTNWKFYFQTKIYNANE